ncbi:hypothetical protein KC318_g207 [Hortaea werneckii]|uniref:Sulfotransferase domain-containing protein n=1 Tax=Hortaea werneckii TaxID=91943 RepID=A0A3M7B1P5_HORWE|nr:hypothetical protein KC334_g97 [Hortaea werneckii]KAI7019256.1 hypothetical protein KC355_g3102 [Hortaea werneckii]KAI7676522.1 hypothetical protein KC318_g207 [Hortaea werneckii]RMY33734.1 hypothetical protein D0866_05721 [Hortaea werneckii]
MATEADYARIGNYARILNPQQNIDRSGASRTVPLQVLCLGYSRTGTLSMHRALTLLNYPNPYHFSSMLDNVLECDLWMQALRAKFYGSPGQQGGHGDAVPIHEDKKFWDGLLGHVSATTDSPANLFGEELVRLYPEAKVVLVDRGVERWFASWMAFCENAYDPFIGLLGQLDPGFLGRITGVGGCITSITAGFAKNQEEARVRSKRAYQHHYRDVREFVPKERLLEFRLEEGWGPLCEFLGREVPDVPFPHVNEKESNRLAFETIAKIGMKRIVRKAFVVLTVVAVPMVSWWFYKRRR